MSFKPTKWDVQIVGRWNVAILTPAAIRARLLLKAADEPVSIEVPVDTPAPFRVKADGLCVMATSSRVAVESEPISFGGVHRAMGVGKRLLDWLPETPVTATGINFRFESSQVEAGLLSALEQPIDRILSDGGRSIRVRETKRSLSYQTGLLNIQAAQDAEGILSFSLNFHLSSSRPAELAAWLDQDPKSLESEVRGIGQLLGLSWELPADE